MTGIFLPRFLSSTGVLGAQPADILPIMQSPLSGIGQPLRVSDDPPNGHGGGSGPCHNVKDAYSAAAADDAMSGVRDGLQTAFAAALGGVAIELLPRLDYTNLPQMPILQGNRDDLIAGKYLNQITQPYRTMVEAMAEKKLRAIQNSDVPLWALTEIIAAEWLMQQALFANAASQFNMSANLSSFSTNDTRAFMALTASGSFVIGSKIDPHTILRKVSYYRLGSREGHSMAGTHLGRLDSAICLNQRLYAALHGFGQVLNTSNVIKIFAGDIADEYLQAAGNTAGQSFVELHTNSAHSIAGLANYWRRDDGGEA